jgi:hypothetical protein
MTDRYFVDTNILVYSRDTRDPASTKSHEASTNPEPRLRRP